MNLIKNKDNFMNVEIEINTNCNRKCNYCPNSMCNEDRIEYMNKETFEQIINQLEGISYNGRVSYHFYNEPLLHKNIVEFVIYVKEKLPNCNQVLYSNGDYLTYELFKILLNRGINLFVVTNHNEVENKRKHKFYSIYNMLDNDEKKSVVYLDNQELNLTNRGGSICIDDTRNEGLRKCSNETPCFIPASLIVIDVEGNVIPCYEDFGREMIVGNIKDKYILDIWNSENYMKLRGNLENGHRHKYNVCKRCNNYTMIDKSTEYDYVL